MIFKIKILPKRMMELGEKIRNYLSAAQQNKKIDDLIEAADEIERLAQVLELVYWDREKVLRDK